MDEMKQRTNLDANKTAMTYAQRLQQKAERLQKPRTRDFLDHELEIVKQRRWDGYQRSGDAKLRWIKNMDKQPSNPKFATSHGKFDFAEKKTTELSCCGFWKYLIL